jgi:hypothetical protein
MGRWRTRASSATLDHEYLRDYRNNGADTQRLELISVRPSRSPGGRRGPRRWLRADPHATRSLLADTRAASGGCLGDSVESIELRHICRDSCDASGCAA